MNLEQQRIKLAEWDGWEYVPETERCPAHWWKNEDGCHFSTDDNGYFAFYLSDLNAVHELKLKLTEDQLAQMLDLLCEIVRRDHNKDFGPMTAIIQAFRSSAKQEAEALLKTLGLWKEETE